MSESLVYFLAVYHGGVALVTGQLSLRMLLKVEVLDVETRVSRSVNGSVFEGKKSS